jgi:nickel-dependent lactate racemase
MPPVSNLFCSVGSKDTALTDAQLEQYLTSFLDTFSDLDQVMLIPPDFTRFHSQAGKITRLMAQHLPESAKLQILPALGTHAPMTPQQIRTMFGDDLANRSDSLFQVHDWRNDVETIGHVPAQLVADATYGKITNQPWPAQLNRRVWEMRNNPKSLVLSIGQVVPHEVMGMANFNKNLFVGVGGVEAIHLSHFIGAVHGMEKMMGRANNPLRDILNYASDAYLKPAFDDRLWYVLTVVAKNAATNELELKGLYIGNDIACYDAACKLSLEVNFTLLEKPPTTMVATMDPAEFQSTWLANKAIYRTRMAMADRGTLVILAPGVTHFGEDAVVDKLIRQYGYVGTPKLLENLDESLELQQNLSAVAHLMHGSSEGRFRIIYCPGGLTRQETEEVGFDYGDLDAMKNHYQITDILQDGWQCDVQGNEFYYISNPALGLWAVPERFESQEE